MHTHNFLVVVVVASFFLYRQRFRLSFIGLVGIFPLSCYLVQSFTTNFTQNNFQHDIQSTLKLKFLRKIAAAPIYIWSSRNTNRNENYASNNNHLLFVSFCGMPCFNRWWLLLLPLLRTVCALIRSAPFRSVPLRVRREHYVSFNFLIYLCICHSLSLVH